MVIVFLKNFPTFVRNQLYIFRISSWFIFACARWRFPLTIGPSRHSVTMISVFVTKDLRMGSKISCLKEICLCLVYRSVFSRRCRFFLQGVILMSELMAWCQRLFTRKEVVPNPTKGSRMVNLSVLFGLSCFL